MTDKLPPPHLPDLIARTQSLVDDAARLETLSASAHGMTNLASDIKVMIETHLKAQNILHEAIRKAVELESQAITEMRKNSEGGAGTLFFNFGREARRIADALEARIIHEDTREPGDFR